MSKQYDATTASIICTMQEWAYHLHKHATYWLDTAVAPLNSVDGIACDAQHSTADAYRLTRVAMGLEEDNPTTWARG